MKKLKDAGLTPLGLTRKHDKLHVVRYHCFSMTYIFVHMIAYLFATSQNSDAGVLGEVCSDIHFLNSPASSRSFCITLFFPDQLIIYNNKVGSPSQKVNINKLTIQIKGNLSPHDLLDIRSEGLLFNK